jgi:hypothetical protein
MSNYLARAQTIQIQAAAANVNSVDYENYTKMLNQLKALEQGYREGRYSLEQYQ